MVTGSKCAQEDSIGRDFSDSRNAGDLSGTVAPSPGPRGDLGDGPQYDKTGLPDSIPPV